MPNVKLIFETDASKSLAQQKKLKNDLRSVEKTAKDSQEKVRKEFNKTSDTIKKLGTALGVTFGAAVILRGLKDTLRTLREFEVELATLRSITGMASEDMVFMKNKAIELSEASTRSAKEVVEAFKLVGSAKPELLKSASALAEVTKQAIILAEAGGITVPEAAIALTGALNMFGKGAKDAAKFTDILATSQQKGSAFISSLSEAMINAGSVAAALGLSFETTNAVLQGFAKGGLQGSRAGMAFAIVMNKLANQADKSLNPAYTDINQLLDNLAAKNLTVQQASKLVGEEASKYLLTLIKQKDIVQELNGTLYEQGNALEQARINTDTMDTSLKNVGKSWDNFVLSIKAGSGIVSTAIKAIADDFTKTFTEMGRVQRAEFEGASKLTKWALQIGSIIDPNVRRVANTILEATGEAEELDQQMEELTDDTDDLNKKLGGDSGAVGLIADLKEKIKGLNAELLTAKTPEEISRINQKIAELNKELKELAALGIAKPIKDLLKDIKDLEIGADLLVDDEDKRFIEEFGEWYTDQQIKLSDEEIRILREKEELKTQIIRGGFDIAFGLTDSLLTRSRNAMEQELAAAGDNEKKKDEIRKKYARKEQNLAVMRAVMGGAEVVINALQTKPFVPAGLAASILAGILVAVQVATIKAQKFATGTLDLRGRGTGTSDSIPAMLSKGESVMTAKETSEYYPYLKSMKEGNFFRFQDEMIDKLADFKAVTNNNLNYDNSKEIKELRAINEALRKNRESEYVDGKFRVIKKGNITTRIPLN